MCFGEVGLDGNRLLEPRLGLVEFTLISKNHTKVVVRLKEPRIERRRALEMRHRVIDLALIARTMPRLLYASARFGSI